MGKAQCGHILVLLCKVRQTVDHSNQLLADDLQTFLHLDNIGIVTNIRTGSTQMDDAGSLRSNLTKGVHMCHNVMTYFLLTLAGYLVINIVDVGFHFVDLFLCNRQTQLLFSLSQGYPQTTPGGELHIRRKYIQHLRAGITGTKRAFVYVAHKLYSFPGVRSKT